VEESFLIRFQLIVKCTCWEIMNFAFKNLFMIFHFLDDLEFDFNFHLYFFDRKYVLSEEEFQRKMCKN
jgi:hypothetical protein